MYVLAKSVKGQEYLYSASSAHAVAKKSMNKICSTLNEIRYSLKDTEVWHIHEVSEYDTAYDYAQFQKFYYTAGGLKEKRL